MSGLQTLTAQDFMQHMAVIPPPPHPNRSIRYSERPPLWRIKRAFTVKFSRVLERPIDIWQILGINAAGLEKHLTKHFKKGMTWENYGEVWEVRPTSLMSDPKGCHYTNFKPQYALGKDPAKYDISNGQEQTARLAKRKKNKARA